MGDRFEDHLVEQDELSRPYRAQRLRFLVEEYGPPKILALSEMAKHCFREARTCYLNGELIACVLVTQAALEDLLRHLFRMAGDDAVADHSTFHGLIQRSLSERFIWPEEAKCMDRLRKRRNPYVHTKGLMHADGFARRIQASDFTKDEWDIMREDAEAAIRCLFALLRRRPFGFHDDLEADA